MNTGSAIGSELERRFARATAVADAICWEGYILYPYRASSAKNRLRFNWGVVGPAEEPTMATEIVVEPDAGVIDLRVRFLHLVTRDDGWDEAVAVCHELAVDTATLAGSPVRSHIHVAGGIDTSVDGSFRQRDELEGAVCVSRRPVGSAGHVALRVAIENTPTTIADTDRQHALRQSFVGCHTLVASDGRNAFVSALDPPDDLVEVIGRLNQHRAWPVLIGPEPARDLVLCSPVILYDYPSVAPESAGDFFDGTEIDEMLALRVATMTDEEKAEARATDPKARAIIDRHDTLEADTMARLHGTTRDRELAAAEHPASPANDVADPNPEWSRKGPNEALAGGVWLTPGSKARIEPMKRADVHDMFLRGRIATVAEVVTDVDGAVHVAVTVDDDPGADLYDAQGRFLYFSPDELVPLESSQSALGEGAGRP